MSVLFNAIEGVVIFTFGYVLGSIAALRWTENVPNFIKRAAGISSNSGDSDE